MNKLFISVTLVLFSVTVLAQKNNLAEKIPSSAGMVCTFSGHQLLEQMPMTEWNNTKIVKAILKDINRKIDDRAITDVREIGLDFDGVFYYYYQVTDSIGYLTLLAPVQDRARFDRFMKDLNDEEDIQKKGNVSTISKHYDGVWMWDDKTLQVVMKIEKSDFFYDDEVKERYGIKDYESTRETPADRDDEDEDAEEVETPAESEEVVIENEEDIQEETVVEAQEDDEATQVYRRKWEIIDSLTTAWTRQYANSVFYGVSNSIQNNRSYTNSRKSDSYASLWIADCSDLYRKSLPLGITRYMANAFHDFKSANLNLVMDKSKIQLAGALEMGPELADVYKKILNHKLNKKIFDYLNEDKMIGYTSFAMNTKAYLESYPYFIAKMMGEGTPYSDEALLLSDLFTLWTDEDAISKVVKGDGIFVFTGITEHKVTYKSYVEDDENFNSIQIEKTKTEQLPDFLFMASSEDPSILNKLIQYGVKKGVIIPQTGYFKLEIPKNPLPVFVQIKNGIVFVGTNEKDMADIAANKFEKKLSKTTRKNLENSNLSLWFNPRKLADKFPNTKTGTILGSMGDISLKTDKINGNIFSGYLQGDVPGNQPNSVKYLISLFESAIEND